MRVFILLLFLSFNSFASISTKYQASEPLVESTIKTTLQPIVINPQIDSINMEDPRFKSILYYIRMKQKPVAIYYFNEANHRPAEKIREQLQNMGVKKVQVSIQKPSNLVDQSIIKIFILDNNNESGT